MRVVVFGSTGMVGGYMARCLASGGHGVTRPTRKDFNAFSWEPDTLATLVRQHDYAVNCIGVFPTSDMPSDLVVAVNALFPNVLQHACASEDVRLIHTSTDGVFGTAGPYFESDAPDAKDLYGRSKALGEPEGAMTLRASIVGLGGRHSLLEWVCQQAQAGERVRGYTSCFWNGITAIEYARCCDQIMKGLWRPGVFHIFSDPVVSKFQLIRQFIEIAALVVELEEDDTVQSQRVLGTKQGLNGGLCVKDLNFQLERLHDDRRQSC